MRIVGIGMDATDIPRISAAIERYGDRFLTRILTDGEQAYVRRHRNPAPSVAGRFAAKEAGMKAIGTGHSAGVFGATSKLSGGAVLRNWRFMARRAATSTHSARNRPF